MITDNTTRNDLNLFSQDGKKSLFSILDFTTTTAGSHKLVDIFLNPHKQIEDIQNRQKTIQVLQSNIQDWPQQISNGTMMVVEKFLETPLANIPDQIGIAEGFFYRIFNGSDFSLITYSIAHCADLNFGMNRIVEMLKRKELPQPIKITIEEIEGNLPKKIFEGIKSSSELKKMSPHQLLRIAKMLHIRYRNQLRNLMKHYAQLDAWLSMAKAMENFNLIFPTFIDKENPVFVAKGLGHLLLENPVRYDIELNETHHFLFLTGANMAGKSTFIKSIGTAVYLAHLGFGVAAESMKLTLFDGILTNINIQDDLTKGESYFYQEVKRIKSTITTIDGGKKWLILIDELFKGTNMSDAINCSLLVIKGLLKRKNALYILSTHLYEISEQLIGESGILFKFFETHVNQDQYEFSYRLLDGVSKDRLGLLILKKEGVIEMLNK